MSVNITSDRHNERLVDWYNERNDLPLASTHLLSFVCLHSIMWLGSFCAWRASVSFHVHEMSRQRGGGVPSCHCCIIPSGSRSRATRYIDYLVYTYTRCCTYNKRTTTTPITKLKSRTNPKLKNKAIIQAMSFCATLFLGCGIFRYGTFEFDIFCGILCNNII